MYYIIFTVMLLKGIPVSPGSILGPKLSTGLFKIPYASSFISELLDADLSSRVLQLVFAQSNTNKQ